MLPTFIAIARLAWPLATAVPFTVIVALLSEAAAVTIVSDTAFATFAQYDTVPETKAGVRVAFDSLSALRSALLLGARSTVSV
ncbi:hypothetical protein D3C79_1067670 [compost metagenome]